MGFFARGGSLKLIKSVSSHRTKEKRGASDKLIVSKVIQSLEALHGHPTYKFILPKYYLKPFTEDLNTTGRKPQFYHIFSSFSLIKYRDNQISSELNHPVAGFSSHAVASCCRFSPLVKPLVCSAVPEGFVCGEGF